MSKKPPSQPKKINLGLQNLTIQKKFTGFKLFNYDSKHIYWIGYLQPRTKGKKYKVKIVFDLTPKVYVLEPEIIKNSPHVFSDNSLCLYHPNDSSYSPTMLLADTIIPWTSEWLLFYEIWLQEGIWWGKSAPHSPNLSKEPD